jgi:hypothetical protein
MASSAFDGGRWRGGDFGNAWRGDAVIAAAALLDAGDQPPVGELCEMSARRLGRHARGLDEVARRERTTAHQRRKNICARGIADQRGDLGHANVCCHENILRSGGAVTAQSMVRSAKDASAAAVVSELAAGPAVPHVIAHERRIWRPDVTMTFLATRSQAARNAAPVLLTMSLGVLIAQIDTSVVNLAVERIGADFDVGVNTLQ